jgi:hypothetical protein
MWSGKTHSRGHISVETSIKCQPVDGVLTPGASAEHSIEIMSDSPVTCRVDLQSSTPDTDLRWAQGTPWRDAPELLPPTGRKPTRVPLVSMLTLTAACDQLRLPRTSHITLASSVTPTSGVGPAGGATKPLDAVPLSLSLRT